MPKTNYIPGLDGIRALAFLMVFWAHALPGPSYYIPATLGVTIFFFLSGYLITTLLRREWQSTGTIRLAAFYWRRLLRIFVPLYVVYALTLLSARYFEHFWTGNRLGMWSLLLYFYNYAVALRLDAALPLGMNVIWSLAVEEHFYLLFPLVYLWMLRRRTTAAQRDGWLVAFCLVELVWRWVLVAVIRENREWTYYCTDARLDSILWGCLLALRNNPALGDRSLLRRAWQPAAAALAAVALAASLLPRNYIYKESLRYTVQALALYVLFEYVIRHAHSRWVRWLEWTPLRYIGWTSYILYLSHDFILNWLVAKLHTSMWVTGPLGFVAALAFATLMRYALELPLARLRARARPLSGGGGGDTPPPLATPHFL